MSDLIIIDITETEKIELDETSNLKDIQGKGLISIRNPTQKSRLWNLTCDLKEIINTTLSSREIDVGILNSNQTYQTDYQIQNLKEPSLKVIETFDTDIENQHSLNNAFRYEMDNKCRLTLRLINPLDQAISNIKLSREVPKYFKDIEIRNPQVGVAGIVGGEQMRLLNWDIVSLDANQKTRLDVIFTIHPEDSEMKALGALDVTYLINNYKLTYLAPEIRGLTDSMSGIEREESSEPGIWECNAEFINDSEFQIRLEDIKITHKITIGSETVVSQAPNRLLNPGQEWNHAFQVESKNVPELNSTIEFTPLFVVITRLKGEIHKVPTICSVISATIEKKISPPEVDAYANTDLEIQNSIYNSGSSVIKLLEVSDELPIDFIPPLVHQIKIQMGEINISARSEYTKTLEILPDNQTPEKKHSIHLILDDLYFVPKTSIILSYPLKARNPRPPTEILYKTPVVIQVDSPVGGKYYKAVPQIEPEIKVKYVKRKLKTLKSIKPGNMEGEFNVNLRIQNKGSVELENIVVKDKIPKGFNITEINLEQYKLESKTEYSELQVKIEDLKGNESFTLTYNCSGNGDYPRYEPLVSVLGRGTPEKETIQNDNVSTPTKIAVSSIPLRKKSIINDIFQEIFKKIDQTITGNDLSNFIDSQRDKFPPGPALHQLMRYSNEIKDLAEDKIIVGSIREQIISKLREFQQIYQ
ncbi:MAG: hypothetical protein ACFFD1_10325 [Candidatus Thorarchaeota archaeon]